jgi:hypothetical protein
MIFKLDMLVQMMYVRSSTMILHFGLIYQIMAIMGNLLFLVLLKLLKSSPNDSVYNTQVQMLFVKSSTKILHLILFCRKYARDGQFLSPKVQTFMTPNNAEIALNPFISSPDPKGQVSYCHHLASVVVVRRTS